MKIGIIGHKRIPSRAGGVEVAVEELAVRMVRHGHCVHVYNRGGRSKIYKGIRIIAIPAFTGRNINVVLYSLLATLRALPERYDIIHYHAEGPGAMIWIPRLFGVKTVCTIHGLDWQRAKWGEIASRYLLTGERIVARYAHAVTVLSESAEKYFRATYGRSVCLIPNGVTTGRNLRPKLISEKYRLEKDGYLLFLARIVPEKGLHYLLEAFSRIRTSKRLIIAGEIEPDNEYFRQISRIVREDSRILMTGFVQGNELSELLTNCFLFILPSDLEGMPLALLEALCHGCRCLISDIPENIEAAGGLAHTFRHSDAESLRQKLESILSGSLEFPSHEEIARTCLSRAGWDDVAVQYLDLYESL